MAKAMDHPEEDAFQLTKEPSPSEKFRAAAAAAVAKGGETMVVLETGATRSSNEGKLDYRGFISPLAMRRFAEYMNKHRVQADGQLRDSDNWKKGMPVERYTESLVRHTFEFWEAYEAGMATDETLCAIMFNVMGLLHEGEKAKLTAAPTPPG